VREETLILVTGGTGFIGRAVVSELLQRGVKTRVLSRNPARKNPFESEVEIIEGDVREPRSLARAMDGVEVVVNCVQLENYPVERPGKGLTFMEIDAVGTANQVRAAAEAGVKRFIYISGAGAGAGGKRAGSGRRTRQRGQSLRAASNTSFSGPLGSTGPETGASTGSLGSPDGFHSCP